jgi:hypothetical protein
MKKPLLLLISFCGLCLQVGCGGGSSVMHLTPLLATHFSVIPATTTPIAGTAFSFTVTALDASNVAVGSYAGTVHFTSSDVQAVLPADSKLMNGTGVFSATLKTAGSQTILATDAATPSIASTSTAAHVSAAPTFKFSVTVPASVSGGTAFHFTVTAEDQFNNTATAYSGTVHFASSDGQATLPSNATLTNGTGTFSAALKTAGSQAITATDTVTGSITGTSSSIIVVGAATHFALTVPATATVGKAFGLTVTPLDAANNVASGYAGTVHFSSTDVQAVLPADSALIGGPTFSPTLKTLGSQFITATDTVTASLSGTSSSINVIALPPLVITSSQPPDGAIGEPYGTFSQICFSGNLIGFELEASGGRTSRGGSSYTWVGSSLPPGLKVVSITFGGPPNCPHGTIWLIEGTPTTAGTYTFSISVSDTATPPVIATAQYTITIKDPAIPAVDTTPPPAIGTLNSPYGFTFTATGGFPPLTWSETGALPPGILPLSSGGVLSGTPTATGSFPITVQVQDSHGRSSPPQNFNIQVMANGFKPTGDLATARVWHTATVFRNGLVLITGGVNATAFPVTAELFDPAKGSFSTSPGSMSSVRNSPTANLLQSGKVLVAGGKDSSGNSVATAELFDPATGTFTPATGSMQTARVYHTATLLADGTVLLTGGLDASGNPTATAELFDPATGTFLSVGNMASARFLHAATLLASGKVLVTGGLTFGSTFDTAELYDPVSKTFLPTGNMTVARAGHTVTALSNGKILVTGGASQFSGNSLSSAELFDPATGTFAATGKMVTPRALHTATLRNDGTVLVAGGDTYFINGVLGRTLSAAELFDPVTGTFTAVADMTTPRESHTATLLLNGEVLIVGGSIGTLGYSATTTVLGTSELY